MQRIPQWVAKRRQIPALNDVVARRSTLIFGTMWMFYAFFLYGLLPLIPSLKPYQNAFFYWSGWVQLWALPLLMVGQNVLGRASETRAQQDHDTIMAEFEVLKQMHDERSVEFNELQQTHQELVTMHSELLAIVRDIRQSQLSMGG